MARSDIICLGWLSRGRHLAIESMEKLRESWVRISFLTITFVVGWLIQSEIRHPDRLWVKAHTDITLRQGYHLGFHRPVDVVLKHSWRYLMAILIALCRVMAAAARQSESQTDVPKRPGWFFLSNLRGRSRWMQLAAPRFNWQWLNWANYHIAPAVSSSSSDPPDVLLSWTVYLWRVKKIPSGYSAGPTELTPWLEVSGYTSILLLFIFYRSYPSAAGGYVEKAEVTLDLFHCLHIFM